MYFIRNIFLQKRIHGFYVMGATVLVRKMRRHPFKIVTDNKCVFCVVLVQ